MRRKTPTNYEFDWRVRARGSYLVLSAHVVEDGQGVQDLRHAAGLGRGSGVVVLVQSQDLVVITAKEPV